MHAFTRKFFAAFVLLIAGRAALADFSSLEIFHPAAAGPGPSTITLPFVEGFEPPAWHIGSANQNVWQNAVSPNMPIIVGAENARGGSQSLRVEDDPLIGPGFPGALYLSPIFVGAPGPRSVSARLYISNYGGADYYISPQSVALNLACARYRFAGRDPNGDGTPGDIEVLDDVNGSAPGGIAFVPTGRNYVAGQEKDVLIDFVGNNQIKYYYGGELIYTGSTLFNDATGLTCNGPQLDQLAIADNQAQFFTTGNYADYDNIAVTPEPATASLLLLAAGAAVRNRSRGRIRRR
jgi:hypothetical protein